MTSEIKLTVGIPTFNNPLGIIKNLTEITKQINTLQLQDIVEIFISDNSDTFETKEAIESMFSGVKYVRYSKNEKNIGFDRNINKILRECSGVFCWTLSDNDDISESSIIQIIDTIEKKPSIGHILLNVTDAYEVYANISDLIKRNNYNILGGLISSNVFNTKYLPENTERYFDNDWIHLSVLFETCIHREIVSVPNILKDNIFDTCRWASGGKTIKTYLNLHDIILNMPNIGYDRLMVNKLDSIFVHGYPRQLITAKIWGLVLDRSTLRKIIEKVKMRPIILIICMFILITPNDILKLCKKIWKRL